MGALGERVTSHLKRRTHEILQIPSAPGDMVGRAFDTLIVTLIALNVTAVILESVTHIYDAYRVWFRAFEWFSITVFGAEYLLRLWSITAEPEYAHPIAGRARWMRSWMAIVDLLAILPALVAFVDLRFLRVMRLLRLLKLGRYSSSLQVLTNVMRDRAQALIMSLFLLGIALVVTSSLMYYAEHEAQPEAFRDIPTSMWWAIVTLSTTGYGDVVPVTVWGRVLGGAITLVGVGVIALPVGILASGFVEELDKRAKHERECPHCGGVLSARRW